jgi:hypothetical protein
MNAQQTGFWAPVLLGGAGVGSVAGLVPLFLGVRKNKTWLAVWGFVASAAGGLAAGTIGAAVVVVIFSILVPRGLNPRPARC